jgi:hypothetical protein
MRGIGRAITNPFGSLKSTFAMTQKANSTKEELLDNSSYNRDGILAYNARQERYKDEGKPYKPLLPVPEYNDTVYAGGGRKRKLTRRIKQKSRRRPKRKSIKHYKGTN